jgi:hypothetical protein
VDPLVSFGVKRLYFRESKVAKVKGKIIKQKSFE